MSESITIAVMTTCGIIISALIASPVFSAKRKKLEEENKQLKNKILELENEIRNLNNENKERIKLTPKDGILYDDNGNAYCPVCSILLQKETDAENESYFNCRNCREDYYLS